MYILKQKLLKQSRNKEKVAVIQGQEKGLFKDLYKGWGEGQGKP